MGDGSATRAGEGGKKGKGKKGKREEGKKGNRQSGFVEGEEDESEACHRGPWSMVHGPWEMGKGPEDRAKRSGQVRRLDVSVRKVTPGVACGVCVWLVACGRPFWCIPQEEVGKSGAMTLLYYPGVFWNSWSLWQSWQ
jgi:hypothetical protein